MKKAGVCLIAMVLMLLIAPQAGAVVTVSISPKSGIPSKSVTVKGNGFNPSALIDVFFDTTAVALTVSNGAGKASATLPIPASAQPGVHWLTLGERRTSAAAQASFTVSTNWPQSGFGPSKRSFNPYENTVGVGNVAQLTPVWSMPLDGYANSKPPILYNNTLYVRDTNQVIRAFSTSGKLLWTATTPFESIPDALTPAAGTGLVFFADNNGNVIAYKALCRSDGGTCTPTWTTNIGSQIAGGLTLRENMLYAPAADGNVHVLNPSTGAPGTSITPSLPGALTSWIAFGADGGGYVAQGTRMAKTPDTNISYSGTLSPPAVGADTAYVTETDSLVREVQFGWTTPLSGSGCSFKSPVFANGVVYAAGCTSLGAYDAGTGGTLWTVTTSGSSQGLAYANGVLYGCISSRLVAYAASYGGKL